VIGNSGTHDGRLAEEPFSCVLEVRGEDAVVTMGGELDLATRDEAEAVLVEAEEAATRAIVVDLRGLRFLGSTGLSILVASAGRATLRGVGHEIVPSEGVRRLLAMTGVDQHLTTREDLPAD
jgi:anti-sigma B factor antagonist